jgi:ribonuclease D
VTDLPVRWVATDADLAETIASLIDEPAYAVDTEFHRERSYFPRVALVQLAGPSGIALIDPLAVDLTPLARLLDGPGVAVLHASQQDLEVLARSCGTIPRTLFDTQLAAGFLGHSSPALVNLLASELGVKLAKGDRLTDWLARPLSDDQQSYAASDVAYLLPLRERLVERLDAVGRTEWAAAECEELRGRPVGPPDPDRAWLRIKDHRHLKGASRGVAQSVAGWRERRAAALDQPVRFVLPDLAILGIAQRPPKDLDGLRRVRGLDERSLRKPVGDELLDAIRRGATLSADAIAETLGEDVPRDLRPAVTLVSAWVSQLARDLKIDTTLLATRGDLVDLLLGSPDARLAEGWRAQLVGDQIRQLVDGEAALAFDGAGSLVLEPRAAKSVGDVDPGRGARVAEILTPDIPPSDT